VQLVYSAVAKMPHLVGADGWTAAPRHISSRNDVGGDANSLPSAVLTAALATHHSHPWSSPSRPPSSAATLVECGDCAECLAQAAPLAALYNATRPDLETSRVVYGACRQAYLNNVTSGSQSAPGQPNATYLPPLALPDAFLKVRS
jgi:hypothetical protein